MFTDDEVQLIQDAFIGKRKLSVENNASLLEKITYDKDVKIYKQYMFFPEFQELLKNNIRPDIVVKKETRNSVALIRSANKSFVIKPLENPNEYNVAQIASSLEVGPKQYPTLSGYITEELIEGDLFSYLPDNLLNSDMMYAYGAGVADILNKLHSKEIIFNDTILSNEFSKSHLFVRKDNSLRLFDFGASLVISNHPNYSKEEIYNYTRTLPFINMFINDMSEEKLDEILLDSAEKIKSLSKEDLLKRDIDFVEEGLTFLSYKYDNNILRGFIKGFQNTYKKD